MLWTVAKFMVQRTRTNNWQFDNKKSTEES